LVIFSPVVSGTERALLPDVDFAWFPLSNPGIISIAVGFLCGYLGTVLSKEYNAAKFAEIELRSLTGVGAEKAAKDGSPGRPRGRAVSARPRSSSAHRFRPQPRRVLHQRDQHLAAGVALARVAQQDRDRGGELQ